MQVEAIQPRTGIPLASAAVAMRMNRERLLRRIQAGEVAGFQDEKGRWFVDPAAMGKDETR